MLHAVVVLPSSGCALVTMRILVPLVGESRDQRRAQRAERLAEIVRHVRRGQHRMLVAADRRHEAEERQLQPPRHVFRRLDRVVHVVEAERHRRPPATRPMASDISHVRRPVGRDRRLRHLGAIDDADVVRAAVARHAQLFLALQQRFVDLAVALRLALHHVVADALAAQILGVGLRRLRGSARASAPRARPFRSRS